MRGPIRAMALVLLVLMISGGLSAYSVLTHEQIVDLLWADEILPLLLKKYPGLTDEQVRVAHSYAYGGAVIQDLGYYPFDSREFSDLVHYVRSGDFVRELLIESQDVNEYAFTLGALSHCASHIAGRPAVEVLVLAHDRRCLVQFNAKGQHCNRSPVEVFDRHRSRQTLAHFA